MKKLKTYRVQSYYRGINHSTLVVTVSQHRAAQIAGISEHHLRNYGSSTAPRPELAEDTHYAEVERSGENPYIFAEHEIGAPMIWADFKAKVDAHRKECPTHRDTLIKYAR